MTGQREDGEEPLHLRRVGCGRGGEAENHHDAVGDGSAGERTKEPGKNLGKWPLATPLVASG